MDGFLYAGYFIYSLTPIVVADNVCSCGIVSVLMRTCIQFKM